MCGNERVVLEDGVDVAVERRPAGDVRRRRAGSCRSSAARTRRSSAASSSCPSRTARAGEELAAPHVEVDVVDRDDCSEVLRHTVEAHCDGRGIAADLARRRRTRRRGCAHVVLPPRRPDRVDARGTIHASRSAVRGDDSQAAGALATDSVAEAEPTRASPQAAAASSWSSDGQPQASHMPPSAVSPANVRHGSQRTAGIPAERSADVMAVIVVVCMSSPMLGGNTPSWFPAFAGPFDPTSGADHGGVTSPCLSRARV